MEKSELVLAIETSTREGSISILSNGKVLGKKGFEEKESVSELLLLRISELLSELNLGLSELNLVAVSVGPGSLTGIRIGVTVARGLANSLGIKCIGVPVLEAMLNLGDNEDNCLAIILAGRDNCYWQFLSKGKVGEIKYGSVTVFLDEFLVHKQTKVFCDKSASDKIKLIKDLAIVNKLDNLSVFIGVKGIEMNKGIEITDLQPIYFMETTFKRQVTI